MRLRFGYLTLGAVLAFGLSGCGGNSEPGEAQMSDAMLEAMNHPPGETNVIPVKIDFFKKGACDSPTPQGFNCSFTVKVSSTNIGASMYNNISSGVFYREKDAGKWMMRPPF